MLHYITVSIPANKVSTVIPTTSLKSVSSERKYSSNNDGFDLVVLIFASFSLTIFKAVLLRGKIG